MISVRVLHLGQFFQARRERQHHARPSSCYHLCKQQAQQVARQQEGKQRHQDLKLHQGGTVFELHPAAALWPKT
ncbi:unnamed protein product [Urochloa humidicola]